MVWPVLGLDRLLFLEREGKVGYRWGRESAELETIDYLEFIARVVSHIPDKDQVMVRYYGLYANAHRRKVRKASRVPLALGMTEEDERPISSSRRVISAPRKKGISYQIELTLADLARGKDTVIERAITELLARRPAHI